MLTKELNRQRRHIRIRSVVSGTEKRPRVVVYKSNLSTYTQVVNDETGKILFGVKTEKSKNKPMEDCKDMGVKVATMLKEKKINEIVFDRNGYRYHGKVKAIAEAMRENGIKF